MENNNVMKKVTQFLNERTKNEKSVHLSTDECISILVEFHEMLKQNAKNIQNTMVIQEKEQFKKIIAEIDSNDMMLDEFVGTIWNKAYCFGATDILGCFITKNQL